MAIYQRQIKQDLIHHLAQGNQYADSEYNC